ncbi:hypothetical protein UFOVP1290_189 [uncultured Caudovirales phage]|uniref:Uncharacterized protein n=1 Tax=uncultured Caudovirales phage TaxID=2100421 RepID=A0A6J5RI28_9CAUD|nr:hypothetical protein UFOVP1290_189 [uncultured Caudovirales phage]
MNKHDKDAFSIVSKVSRFMQEDCYKIDQERAVGAMDYGIPHGDMAYGQALAHWIKNGKPSNAWFSYAPGEHECQYLLAFRKEISDEFGLEILTTEEGEARRKNEVAKGVKIKTHNTYEIFGFTKFSSKDYGAN